MKPVNTFDCVKHLSFNVSTTKIAFSCGTFCSPPQRERERTLRIHEWLQTLSKFLRMNKSQLPRVVTVASGEKETNLSRGEVRVNETGGMEAGEFAQRAVMQVPGYTYIML